MLSILNKMLSILTELLSIIWLVYIKKLSGGELLEIRLLDKK